MHKRPTTSRWSMSGQSGFSLMETLIALAILSVIVGGVTTGIITTIRAGSTANRAQRADLLLTSFGEAVKQLPYQPCLPVNGPTSYNEMWNEYQSSLAAAGQPILTDARSSVTIAGVRYGDSASCVPGEEDPGYVVFDLKASFNGVTRTGQVVSRNPDAAPPAGKAILQVTPWSSDGDPEVAFGLTAVGSYLNDPIVLYAYNCDADDPDSSLVYSSTANDPRVACVYSGSDVPPVGATAGKRKRITLTVSDASGIVRATAECSTGTLLPAGNTTRTGVVSYDPCTVQIAPQFPVPPEGFTPLVPPLPDAGVDPPDPAIPPGTNPEIVSDFWLKGNGGCCATWAKFQFPALPGVSHYEIKLVWYLGSWATFTQGFTIPSTTPAGSIVTYQFTQDGLSLLEKYKMSIRAKLPDGTWGPWFRMNGGANTCLSNKTISGTNLCILG